MPEPDCVRVRDLLAELAVGALPGDERAIALAHLPGCAGCAAELAALVATVDGVLALTPAEEPPPGFADAVLDRIAPGPVWLPPAEPFVPARPVPAGAPPRRRRRWRAAVAVAAGLAVAASAAGAVWVAGADDRRVADDHRRTLTAASGRYFAVGSLNPGTGRVIAYQGDPSWVFVIVRGIVGSGRYQVRVTAKDGRRIDLGTFDVEDGTGSWGTTITLPVDEIGEIRLEDSGNTGLKECSAHLKRT